MKALAFLSAVSKMSWCSPQALQLFAARDQNRHKGELIEL